MRVEAAVRQPCVGHKGGDADPINPFRTKTLTGYLHHAAMRFRFMALFIS